MELALLNPTRISTATPESIIFNPTKNSDVPPKEVLFFKKHLFRVIYERGTNMYEIFHSILLLV